MGLFSKVSKGATSLFKKVDSGANQVFKKVNQGINQAGNIASNVANQATGVAKQAGNFLEKNAGTISDVAAGVALASGVGAEFAPAILAAGNSAQMAGSRLKKGAVGTNKLLQSNISQSQSKASDFNNSLSQSVKSAINQGNTTSQNMINQAQSKANNLGDQLNNAIGSAQNAMSGPQVQIV